MFKNQNSNIKNQNQNLKLKTILVLQI